MTKMAISMMSMLSECGMTDDNDIRTHECDVGDNHCHAMLMTLASFDDDFDGDTRLHVKSRNEEHDNADDVEDFGNAEMTMMIINWLPPVWISKNLCDIS